MCVCVCVCVRARARAREALISGDVVSDSSGQPACAGYGSPSAAGECLSLLLLKIPFTADARGRAAVPVAQWQSKCACTLNAMHRGGSMRQ